jgi:hypothetical protein
MSQIGNMDKGDWVYVIGSCLVAGMGVLAAAEGWDAINSPAQVFGACVAFLMPLVTFFKQAPPK